MRKIRVTKNRASNKGLEALDGQLISPCELTHTMVLNATDFKSNAEIASSIIDSLNQGNIKTFMDIKTQLRSLGYQFSNGEMTQTKFIQFLTENAEIEHSYNNIGDLKSAYRRCQVFDDAAFFEEE